MSDFLEPWQIEAINFIERVHNSAGSVPLDTDIIEYLKYTKGFKNINSESIEILKSSNLFKASMDSRGIVVNTDNPGELREVNSLTSRQMAAIEVMLNLTDRRSDEKKLRDIGVSTAEYSSWTQNNLFAAYLRDRSEQLINNSVHDAHIGLLRGVRQGNTASIKLYYEMTGRYNPNEENNVNVRLLIAKVLEAIQKHVRDPNTLNSLAVELSQLAIEVGTPVAKAPFVTGDAIRKELS